MPTYIALLKWTEKGIAGVKGSPARLDAGRAAFKAAGINMTDVYMTMGRYDLICVLEAADDETLAKGMLTLGSQGEFAAWCPALRGCWSQGGTRAEALANVRSAMRDYVTVAGWHRRSHRGRQ